MASNMYYDLDTSYKLREQNPLFFGWILENSAFKSIALLSCNVIQTALATGTRLFCWVQLCRSWPILTICNIFVDSLLIYIVRLKTDTLYWYARKNQLAMTIIYFPCGCISIWGQQLFAWGNPTFGFTGKMYQYLQVYSICTQYIIYGIMEYYQDESKKIPHLFYYLLFGFIINIITNVCIFYSMDPSFRWMRTAQYSLSDHFDCYYWETNALRKFGPTLTDSRARMIVSLSPKYWPVQKIKDWLRFHVPKWNNPQFKEVRPDWYTNKFRRKIPLKFRPQNWNEYINEIGELE